MSNKRRWDFSGWATKTNMRCSDGRTIKKDAFRGCDGLEVPLVWNHRHNDPSEVLGHALLENREDGVYAYCSFNNSEKGLEAKELVRHGDIKSLSIYANQLVQSSKTPPCDVIHGTIREVSLVLAGANPGAFIDNVLVHGEIHDDEAEIFHSDEDGFYFNHADDDEKEDNMGDEKTVGEVLETLNKEQKAAVGILIQQILGDQKNEKGGKNLKHASTRDDDDEDEDDDEYDEDEDEEDDDEYDEDEDEEDDRKLRHADEDDDEYDDEEDEEDETIEEVIDTLSPKQRRAVETLIGIALSGEDPSEIQHSDEDGETIGDVIDTLSSKQMRAVEALVGLAVTHSDDDDDEDEDEDDEDYEDDEDSDEEEDEMKHNAFDVYDNEPVLSHADQKALIQKAIDGKKSLKQTLADELEDYNSSLSHAITDHNDNSVTYGVANIDYMFPDARMIGNQPELINRNQDWVEKVINGTHHTPFSRVKSLFADITGEDARARGYVKGNQKVHEVVEALKRETTPQTIYKLQKLDRDDIVDITDFDVVAWLKAEMQIMLKAEIARAILIGDGRQAGNDKIKETNVRPIYNDVDLFTVKVPVSVPANSTDTVKGNAIVDAAITSRYQYKGSGNPTLFIDQQYLGKLLVLKDGMGRRLYETRESLAAAMDVKEIVAVDVMDGQTIELRVNNTTVTKPVIGIIVNLQDYNVGADKGGQTSFFDDFDINFNQYEYLYETRMSGALIKPYSAMTLYLNEQ